jgi:hypothetical protein
MRAQRSWAKGQNERGPNQGISPPIKRNGRVYRYVICSTEAATWRDSMALIENAKGRRADQSPSGYTRLFGVPELGNLMSRIQAAVISSGSELERLIWDRVLQIDGLDHFLQTTLHSEEDKVFVARKQQIKNCKTIISAYEPDFLAFHPLTRNCYIVEVKDGDQFDTKKAAGEHQMLGNFRTDISHSVPYITHVYLCSFNASTKEEIFRGLKRKFQMGELVTGRELCDLFRIQYESIVSHRLKDQLGNLKYVAHELLAIEGVRDVVLEQIEAMGSTRLSSVAIGRDEGTTPVSISGTATPTPDQLEI